MKIAQIVEKLPGELDDTLVFHSNSPEVVLQSGVLLSTFASNDKASPEAHLDCAVDGPFCLFLHHITDRRKSASTRTLYLGVLIGNAGDRPVFVRELQAATFTSKPDAPFTVLEPVLANDDKSIYAGPGDRVSLEMLDRHDNENSEPLLLSPGETKLVHSLPLPTGSVLHPLNGRTGLYRFHADGPIYLAVVSAFAEAFAFFAEKPPTVLRFLEVLTSGQLVQPRDKAPTAPDASGELIYGRVAGVARGDSWRAVLTNDANKTALAIVAGQTISYPICTLRGGTLGTAQIQSAPMVARYADTAYESHGNYGVTYDLNIPILNNDVAPVSVSITFQSPLKSGSGGDSLTFLNEPSQSVVFRGTVKFTVNDSRGTKSTRAFHLVQTKGMQLGALLEFTLSPQEACHIAFSVVYPADCTPPHVLTISATC